MRARDSQAGALSTLRCALAVTTTVLIGACSSLPPANPPQTSARAEQPAARGSRVAETPPSVPTERRRRDFPEVETDATGFTITEQIRISGEVRADYQRALQLLELQQYDQGISLLTSITERAPDVTAPYIDLGIAYGRTGDLERAETALETASELSPEHPIVYNELGILYRRTGRFADARASYERALSVFPGFHFARRNLAVLCDLYLADLVCALEHYEGYLESVGTDDEVEIWVADIRNRLGS